MTFERAAQARLGDLYGMVADLVASKADDAIVRAAMGKLVEGYGAMQVAWVVGVIRNDVEAGRR